MTAPDSRDSVERVVAEMQHYANGSTSLCPASVIDKWADRLQALARGPQRAGGGAAKWTPEEVARQLAERPNQPHYIAALVRKAIAHETAALQAEVARLTGANDALADALREANKGYVHELNRAETAEAALREAHEGEVSQVEWEDSDRIIVHIEKDEGDVMMWEDVREGVRVRIAGPRLVRDGDSGEGES